MFKEDEVVYYDGVRAEVTDVYDDGYIQIKFPVGGGQNRVRLVKASLLEKEVTIESNNSPRSYSPPGTLSNRIIQKRNGGVRHQFQDSIGGCSSNYR